MIRAGSSPPGAPPKSPTWIAGHQTLELPSAALPRLLAEGRITSGTSRTPIQDAGGGFTSYTTMLPLELLCL